MARTAEESSPPPLDLHIRRVRRGDLEDIVALLERAGLPAPANDRASLRRFRNLVADLGSDFYVAIRRARVCGFFHLAYARDLLYGNRAQLLALIAGEASVRAALLGAAVERARLRHCHDVTAVDGSWRTAELAATAGGWRPLDGAWRLPLDVDGDGSGADLPGGTQTCRG